MTGLKEFFNDLEAKDRSFLYSGIGLVLAVGAISILVLPVIFTSSCPSLISFKDTGGIGDTINGISSPFIGLLAAFLTFMAFFIQYRANKVQVDQFKAQQKSLQDQIDQNKRDSDLEKFEKKFYEMLALHRANVSEMEIKGRHGTYEKRKVFVAMFNELKFCYYLTSIAHSSLVEGKSISRLDEDDLIHIAYIFFFTGIGQTSDLLNQHIFKTTYSPVLLKEIGDLLKTAQKNFEKGVENTSYNKDITLTIKYKPFMGHMSRLGHYYRHLFQMVKFIANQPATFLSDKQKYDYIKLIRAQLSNHEQLLMYYNAASSLGEKWITKGYFADYRLIHNLPLPLADFGPAPIQKLGGSNINKYGKRIFEWGPKE